MVLCFGVSDLLGLVLCVQWGGWIACGLRVWRMTCEYGVLLVSVSFWSISHDLWLVADAVFVTRTCVCCVADYLQFIHFWRVGLV
jgi:hypothetical protein